MPEPVDGPADVAEFPRMIQIHHLGSDDPGRLGLHRRGLDEAGDGVLVQDGVAVEQENVVGRGHGGLLEHRREGPRVADRLVVAEHP